jgi:hypothetical protein
MICSRSRKIRRAYETSIFADRRNAVGRGSGRPNRAIAKTGLDMEAVYLFLIGLGWIFLLGWVVMLLWACAAAFRKDSESGPVTPRVAHGLRIGR